jgi:hypothetical protein
MVRPGESELQRLDDEQWVLRWLQEQPPYIEREQPITLDELAELEGRGFTSPATPITERTLDEQIAALRTRRDQIDARLAEIMRKFPGGYED